MSIIYLYDENIRKSRELPERNLQRLLDKYNQFKSLKMMQNLDKERKEEILEPFIHKFERHMGEKRQQIDGLEKISLYLDELLEKRGKVKVSWRILNINTVIFKTRLMQ